MIRLMVKHLSLSSVLLGIDSLLENRQPSSIDCVEQILSTKVSILSTLGFSQGMNTVIQDLQIILSNSPKMSPKGRGTLLVNGNSKILFESFSISTPWSLNLTFLGIADASF